MSKIYFDRIPLRDFAKKVQRDVDIRPTEEYRTLGCRLYGQGVYQRETKIGAKIKAARMFLVRENDFVIDRIWAQKGSSGIVTQETSGSVVTQDFPVFVLDSNKVLPAYLAWYLKTKDFWEECRRHSHGTSGRQRLSPKDIPNLTFPLCEMSKQEQIVSKIGSIMSKIDEAEKLRLQTVVNTGRLLPLMLVQVLEREKASYIIEPLEQISEKIADIDHAMPRAVENGMKFVSPKDFTPEGIDFSNCKRISEEDFERLRRKIQPRRGDILYSRIGTVGQARLVETDKDFLASYSIVTIRPKPQKCLSKYLLLALQSPTILEHARIQVRAIAMPDLGIKNIRDFRIPLPPVPEQQRIVSYFESLQPKISELKRLQIETETELDRLKPSILDVAFKGEL